jgi:hypothetical protein
MRNPNAGARALVALVAASMAVMIVIGPVAAVPAGHVHIVSQVTFDPTGNYGTFEASGGAVDDGLVCATGSFVDTGLGFHGFQSGSRVQILVLKTFTCPGAGTFFVKMQITASFDGTESFAWVIQGGTDAYANLRGGGDGSTVPVFDPQTGDETGNVNTYDGVLAD